MTGTNQAYISKLEKSTGTIELQRLVLALRRLGAEITITSVDSPAARSLSPGGRLAPRRDGVDSRQS